MINEILTDRKSRYGTYMQDLKDRQAIMDILIEHNRINNIEPLTPIVKAAIGDIVGKLVRISSQPSYNDSWDDVIGYSTLVRKEKVNESNA